MKKFALSVLTAGVLLGSAIVSQAQTLTYQLLTDTPWTTTGVAGSNTGGGGATFDSAFMNTLFEPIPNPFEYTTPSVLKFGDDFTSNGLGMNNSFTNFVATPIDFNFTLTSGADVDTYHAVGQIDGLVGIGSTGAPFSQARITFTSLTDSLGNIGVLSVDPNNGLGALAITSLINGNTVNVFLDSPQSKPAPNLTLTTAGYITVTQQPVVPEPGTVALLASSCITGSVFLLRRRMRRA